MQQLNPNTTRSVSPFERAASSNVKLVLFANLDDPKQSQKSYRVKDSTTLFDLINYLKQFHGDSIISLFANNQPILENLNSYAVNILLQYKLSVIHYRAKNRIVESCIVQQTADDEGPGLNEKIKNSVQVSFTPSLMGKRKQKISQSANLSLTFTRQQAESAQQFEQFMKEQAGDVEEPTVREIKCNDCDKIYNSTTLRNLIVSAMGNDQFARCDKCKTQIKRNMYGRLNITFIDYEDFRNRRNYKIFYTNITEYDLKDKSIRIAKCQNCQFICFWQKNLKVKQKGYCPSCLQFTIDSPFEWISKIQN